MNKPKWEIEYEKFIDYVWAWDKDKARAIAMDNHPKSKIIKITIVKESEHK